MLVFGEKLYIFSTIKQNLKVPTFSIVQSTRYIVALRCIQRWVHSWTFHGGWFSWSSREILVVCKPWAKARICIRPHLQTLTLSAYLGAGLHEIREGNTVVLINPNQFNFSVFFFFQSEFKIKKIFRLPEGWFFHQARSPEAGLRPTPFGWWHNG